MFVTGSSYRGMSRFARCACPLIIILLTVPLVAQELDPAGIKAKVDEAVRLRGESNAASARNERESGQQLAEQSAQLFREALDEYKRVGADESDDIALLLDYANLLTETGDYDLAEGVLLRAAKLEPDDAAIWLKLGQTMAAMGPQRESTAILALRRAAGITPATKATAEANASLGSLYQQAGLYEFAREAYSRTLELESNHTGAKLALAALDAREGRMVEAEEAFASIEGLSPDFGPFIQRTLGPALDHFGESRRWLTDTAESHFAYAKLLIRVDRIADAFWPLNRALKLDDQNYVAWNLMGSVLRAMERYRGAREAFMRSLELNPDQPRTREALNELDAFIAAQPPVPAEPAAPAEPSPAAPDATPAVPGPESAPEALPPDAPAATPPPDSPATNEAPTPAAPVESAPPPAQ